MGFLPGASLDSNATGDLEQTLRHASDRLRVNGATPVQQLRVELKGAATTSSARNRQAAHRKVPRCLVAPSPTAPQFFQAIVAAAAAAVERIANRILLVVVLVILLGRIKRGRLSDLGDDARGKGLTLFQRGLAVVGRGALAGVVHEDRGPVLRADVTKLAIANGRIDVDPENLQQFLISNALGVIHDLYRFGVSRPAGRYLLVGRTSEFAAGIPGGGRDDAFELVERRLHAPEATAGKSGLGERLCRIALRRGSTRCKRGHKARRKERCNRARADAKNRALHRHAAGSNFSTTPLLQ